ncbi:MAG TPA: helix-turn-helix domain-containing GNAT family N-acetyltransferase [Blastocatellia bacterium]|nr:helix-turn-helix domain-containing GNAT family N-acetyltransferase [Blastocatellia bacterium]
MTPSVMEDGIEDRTGDGMEGRIEAVRRFNRLYTLKIGLLGEGHLNSPFSLTETRVLYELARREKTTATELMSELFLDGGYLSRILRRFHKAGLITKKQSEADGRQNLLSLTAKGKKAFAPLIKATVEQIRTILSALPTSEQNRVVDAMHTLETLLGDRSEPKVPYILRPHRPGDIGWVAHRHGVLYAQEYGWDERFEAFVAEIVAKFINEFDPKRERCWIAEREGENVGCVFLVKDSDEVARLRTLLVEPSARGLGIGTRLVDECIRFARQAGYRKLVLWTNDILVAARRIYEAAGFRLVEEEKVHKFGHDNVFQNWELDL